MGINDLKYKIHVVPAAARIVVQGHGHTRKYAKYIVALIVNRSRMGYQIENLQNFFQMMR